MVVSSRQSWTILFFSTEYSETLTNGDLQTKQNTYTKRWGHYSGQTTSPIPCNQQEQHFSLFSHFKHDMTWAGLGFWIVSTIQAKKQLIKAIWFTFDSFQSSAISVPFISMIGLFCSVQVSSCPVYICLSTCPARLVDFLLLRWGQRLKSGSRSEGGVTPVHHNAPRGGGP